MTAVELSVPRPLASWRSSGPGASGWGALLVGGSDGGGSLCPSASSGVAGRPQQKKLLTTSRNFGAHLAAGRRGREKGAAGRVERGAAARCATQRRGAARRDRTATTACRRGGGRGAVAPGRNLPRPRHPLPRPRPHAATGCEQGSPSAASAAGRGAAPDRRRRRRIGAPRHRPFLRPEHNPHRRSRLRLPVARAGGRSATGRRPGSASPPGDMQAPTAERTARTAVAAAKRCQQGAMAAGRGCRGGGLKRSKRGLCARGGVGWVARSLVWNAGAPRREGRPAAARAGPAAGGRPAGRAGAPGLRLPAARHARGSKPWGAARARGSTLQRS
jgi:hypothetical protein